METIRWILLLMFLVLPAPLSRAAETAPDALLNAATSEVMAALKQSRDQPESPAKLAAVVETTVLPLFDFSRMTQLAAARNWRLASPFQQNALVAEFKTLLVRTYSTALGGYRDQVVTYRPLRAASDDTDVTVRSEVKQGAAKLKIDYEMAKTSAGWKVYDVKLDGVSLVTAYRPGFAAKVRDAGVDGLIQALAEKNRPDKPAARPLFSIAVVPASAAESRPLP